MEQIAHGTDALPITADLGPACDRKAVTVIIDCDDDRHYDVSARLSAADPGFRLLVAGVRSGTIRGIWGIGSDFGRMVRLHPELPAVLEAGGVALFDHERAGHTFKGLPIRSPAEMAGFDGGIGLTPSSPASRGSMARHAHGLGLPPDRLIDPYAARR